MARHEAGGNTYFGRPRTMRSRHLRLLGCGGAPALTPMTRKWVDTAHDRRIAWPGESHGRRFECPDRLARGAECGERRSCRRDGVARARDETAVLCRCGYSSDKPFCDVPHVKMGFSDKGRLPADSGAAAGVGRLTITPIVNGPNQCKGPLTIRDVDGRTSGSDSTLLCRCGGSQNKPYCDGTHKKIGWVAEGSPKHQRAP